MNSFKTLVILLFIYEINLINGYNKNKTIHECSNSRGSNGKAVQIIEMKFNNSTKQNYFVLNEQNLGSILLSEEIKDKQVMVMSIAGSLRRGKSFFMNLVLQYLEKSGFIGKSEIILRNDFGFQWGSGVKRITEGMLMWSKPFCIDIKDNKEMAILIMDTQGAFDPSQDFGDTSIIFALSFLISNVQIYNIANHVQESDLQNLKVFVDFGKLISRHNSNQYKPFKEVVFLVRDWMNSKQYEYGTEGGREYLDKAVFKPKISMPESNIALRNGIIQVFEEIEAHLMPHPGLKVAQGDFKAQDIDEDFIYYLNKFCEWQFIFKLMTNKAINDNEMTGKLLFDLIKVYIESLKDGKPDSLHEAACKANNKLIFEKSKSMYDIRLNLKCSQPNYIDDNELKLNNDLISDDLIKHYNSSHTLECPEYTNIFSLKTFTDYMDERFLVCDKNNYNKGVKECEYRVDLKVSETKNLYNILMTNVCQSSTSVHPNELHSFHTESYLKVLKNYDEIDNRLCLSYFYNFKTELFNYMNTYFISCNVTNWEKLMQECLAFNRNEGYTTRNNYINYMKDYCFTQTTLPPLTLEETHNYKTTELQSAFEKHIRKECYEETKPITDDMNQYIDSEYERCSENNRRQRLDVALNNCYQTDCVIFNHASCDDDRDGVSFTCVDKWSCGVGFPNYKKKKCCQNMLDGVKIRDTTCYEH